MSPGSSAVVAVEQALDKAEAEFLELGTVLSTVADASVRSVSTADDLVLWSTGRLKLTSSVCARESLERVLDLLQEYDRACRGILSRASREAEAVGALIARQETVRKDALQVLFAAAVLKLESLHLPEADRVAVEDLTIRIPEMQERLSKLCESSMERLWPVRQNAQQTSQAMESLMHELRERTHALRRELRALSYAPLTVLRLEREIERAKSLYADSFSRSVMALQAQDLVRQRLNHVLEAVRNEAQGGGASLFYEIQRRQTEAALNDLEVAEKSVRAELDRLCEQASKMAASAGNAQAHSGGSGNFRVDAIVSEVQTVEGLLLEAARLSGALVNRFEPVARVMDDFQEQLHTVEFELHLLTLNTQVLATRVTRAGCGVDVAADWAAMGCREAMQGAESVAAGLDSVVRATQELAAGLDVFEGNLRDTASALSQQSSALPEQAQRAQAQLRGAIDSLERDSADLQGMVREVLGRLDMTSEIRAHMGSVIAHAKESRTAAGGETACEDRDTAIAMLAERYTMESEREVHATVQGEDVEPAAPIADEEGLGENVELF